MLIAACDRFGDDIDVSQRLIDNSNKEDTEKHLAVLFGKSVFYNSKQIENDGLLKNSGYVHLDDSP